MKLKFERFEGLACFSIREQLLPSHMPILQVGLETILKGLQETLVINFSLAHFDENVNQILQATKKGTASLTTQKVFWVSKAKGLGDFATLEIFVTRLNGFKHRQVGERIRLDDDVHVLQSEVKALEAKITALGGDQDRAWKIIVENRVYKEQERILKQSIKWQEDRMKVQAVVPTEDPENATQIGVVKAELKKLYGQDIDL